MNTMDIFKARAKDDGHQGLLLHLVASIMEVLLCFFEQLSSLKINFLQQ